jgi:FAD-dependent urate hydroxylase
MNRNLKIAIIGGGIGGLTTAIALSKKGFHNISILERRSEQQSPGAGVVLWANAVWVLNQLNLQDEVSQLGGTVSQMQRWTCDNEFLGALDISQIDHKIGSKSIAVSKKEFYHVLLQKVKAQKIGFQPNTCVTAIEERENNKSCIRLDEAATMEADIIIGADGRMNSVARKYIHGSNGPIYQNYVNWVGIAETDQPHGINNYVLDYWGVGERFGIVPINQNKLYWAGCKALQGNKLNQKNPFKQELLTIFRNWPSPIAQIIEHTHEHNIKRIAVFDHDPNINWYKKNVCLLGDAAHASLPTSGQGACQAIEDAWHLSNALFKYETLKEAFEAYKAIRFEKTTMITIAAREFARSLFNDVLTYCQERNKKAQKTDYQRAADGMAALWLKNLKE